MIARSSLGAMVLSLLTAGWSAGAQSRERVCVTTEARRLLSAPFLLANGSDRIVAAPFAQPSREGAAFVVALRDPERTLRVGERRGLRRAVTELELRGAATPPEHLPGMVFARVNRELGLVGEPVFVEDPTSSRREGETFPPGVPVGVTVEGGVLVIAHVAGDLYATLVAPEGPVAPLRRVAQAPPTTAAGTHGFVWLTATARTVHGHAGAVALGGTEDGEVVALSFDGQGERVGDPVLWQQHVGGSMQLLPLPPGADPAALLERPVRGATVTGEQAREQVLVRLTDTLEPSGEPARLGLGPYPTAATMRGSSLVLSQWAEGRGLAVSTLPVARGRLQVETPRLWTTRDLEGAPLGHTMITGGEGVLYDLATNGDTVAGGLHAYLVYFDGAGTPFPRRDVFPLRARVIAPPVLLPAEDGVVAVMANVDEMGGGVDAVHVRCDLVTLPQR
ncbi:MAG: hypothetical protein Q8S73_12535 [Deltaproteobacteria bacterium]|nr:hypothetical protein [Deltaproteobacteria bacterium]